MCEMDVMNVVRRSTGVAWEDSRLRAAEFMNDLKADSLAMVTIFLEIEAKLGVDVEQILSHAGAMRTVSDLIAAVQKIQRQRG